MIGDLDADAVIRIFDDCFAVSEQTVLRGGGDEPLYQPSRDRSPAVIIFRNDYVASAFHEVAHWCIAGRQRRQLEDFGYWYAPDGRDADQQRAFFTVEDRPQAVEWFFHIAAGTSFRVSVDNLDGDPGDAAKFAERVVAQALSMCERGLPPRARCFADALARAQAREQALADFRPSIADLI